MAQTGFTPIQLYSTSTAAAVPLAGNLTNSTLGSELAINITDGKLFYKDNANAVQVIGWKTVPTTAGGTGLTTYTAGDLVYYASGTTLTKLGIGAANTVLTSSGTAPQWSTNLNISSLTATSISDSGNLTFTGTGNRITGDFSNTTIASRVMFQSSTTNAQTQILAIPNGTSTQAVFEANSDSSGGTNAVIGQIGVIAGAEVRITSGIRGTGTYQPMTFFTGGSEAMRIFTSRGVSIGDTTDPGAGNLRLGTGNLVIGTSGKGIDFSVTPGTGTSELFADYEEGTWTPAIAFGGASVGVTYVSRSGSYTKIGRMVYFYFAMELSSKGSSTGNITITGFPFTALGDGQGWLRFSYNASLPSLPVATIDNGAVIATLRGTPNNMDPLTNTNISGTANIQFQGFYTANP